MAVTWLETPLRVVVRPASSSATDAVFAVAAVLALERVAPHADVELIGFQAVDDDRDGVVTAGDAAVGILVEPVDLDPLRAATTAGLVGGAVIGEDHHGGWYRVDDDTARTAVDATPWALTGWLVGAVSFRAATERGRILESVVRGTGAGPDLRAALTWASGEVDRVLAEVCRSDPSRVRRWLTELSAEVTRANRRLAVLESRHPGGGSSG